MSKRDDAKILYVGGLRISDVARKVGVSRRSIERWADEGGWHALKTSMLADPSGNSHQTKQSMVGELERAISRLSSAVQETEPKSLEGCASALGKLVELHRKLVPETVDELAARAVELGIKPQDFIRALKDQWLDQDPNHRMSA